MCEAIQILNQRAEEKGRMETLTQNIKNLMDTMGWTVEQTMDNMKVTEDDRKLLTPFLS